MTIESTAKSPASVRPSSLPAKPRIFSGIQPTGRPHLGNDLGAIRNYVALGSQAAAEGAMRSTASWTTTP